MLNIWKLLPHPPSFDQYQHLAAVPLAETNYLLDFFVLFSSNDICCQYNSQLVNFKLTIVSCPGTIAWQLDSSIYPHNYWASVMFKACKITAWPVFLRQNMLRIARKYTGKSWKPAARTFPVKFYGKFLQCTS
jgi:hypothetical protein